VSKSVKTVGLMGIHTKLAGCLCCGVNFRHEDLIEIDRIIPKSKGGKNQYDNLQALHIHCHDIKTACDGSNGSRHQEPNH